MYHLIKGKCLYCDNTLSYVTGEKPVYFVYCNSCSMRGPEDRISSSCAIEKYNEGYNYPNRLILDTEKPFRKLNDPILEPGEMIVPPPKKMQDYLDSIGKPHGPETLTIEIEDDMPLNVDKITEQIYTGIEIDQLKKGDRVGIHSINPKSKEVFSNPNMVVESTPSKGKFAFGKKDKHKHGFGLYTNQTNVNQKKLNKLSDID